MLFSYRTSLYVQFRDSRDPLLISASIHLVLFLFTKFALWYQACSRIFRIFRSGWQFPFFLCQSFCVVCCCFTLNFHPKFFILYRFGKTLKCGKFLLLSGFVAQDTKELRKRRVERVQNLDCYSLIHGDAQVLNLRLHITDFGHKFLDIFAVSLLNFV